MRIQNLRSFTVQVRAQDRVSIEGTAFAVERSRGLFVTCRHVAENACAPGTIQTSQVWLYLPQLADGPPKLRSAHVIHQFTDVDDDVTVLELDEPPLPNEIEVALLGRAERSIGNRFRSFGYRRLQDYHGLPASGEIVGFTDIPRGRRMYCEPLMMLSQHIDSGMSGAAILDISRNLVVGVIAETWDTADFADRDSNFAVDIRSLEIAKLDITLYDEYPFELSAHSAPLESGLNLVNKAAITTFPLPFSLYNAPGLIGALWVGRKTLLSVLTESWNRGEARVIGLIGLGGEGKSSATRKWLDLLAQKDTQPDGVFWWGFYHNKDLDAFLHAAIEYLGGAELAARFQSVAARVDLLAAMLQERRFLLVLDGLEVLQDKKGDNYGAISNVNLQRLVEMLSNTKSRSLCIITSRISVTSLVHFSTYQELIVDRLETSEGCELLRKLGVKADDAQLADFVEKWAGHALTLELLGADIVARYRGRLTSANTSLSVTLDSPYKQILHILDQYETRMTTTEKTLLLMLSVHRVPVTISAFMFSEPIVSDTELRQSIEQLLNLRLIREIGASPPAPRLLATFGVIRTVPFDEKDGVRRFTLHPLISNYFREKYTSEGAIYEGLHSKAINYYLQDFEERIQQYFELRNKALSLGADVGFNIVDFQPLEELVHHLCKLGLFREAYNVFMDGLKSFRFMYSRKGFALSPFDILVNKLHAHERALSILSEFFHEANDYDSILPAISDKSLIASIHNQIGLALYYDGRYKESIRSFELSLQTLSENTRTRTYVNLTNAALMVGNLEKATAAADSAVEAAGHEANTLAAYRVAYVAKGWSDYFNGSTRASKQYFVKALDLERKIDGGEGFLYSTRGIKFGQLLIRTGELEKAEELCAWNYLRCRNNQNLDDASQSARLLGDIYSIRGEYESASTRYETALYLAELVGIPGHLSEARTSISRLALLRNNLEVAEVNIYRALDLATRSGLRCHEMEARLVYANIRIAQEAYTEAHDALNQVAKDAREVSYPWAMASCEHSLGVLAIFSGDRSAAQLHFDRAVHLRQSLNDVEIAETKAFLHLLDKSDQSSLIGFLDNTNRDIRLAALRLLAHFQDVYLASHLVKALNDEDGRIQEVAYQTLVRLEGGALDQLIDEFSKSTVSVTRVRLLNVLGRIQNRKASTIVCAALNDPEEQIQIAALTALEQIDDPATSNSIIALLTSSENQSVIEKAITVLGRFRNSSGEGFQVLLRSSNVRLRRETVKILVNLDITQSYLLLLTAIGDDDSTIRDMVASRIVNSYSPEMAEDILSYLHNNNPTARAVAAQILGYVGQLSAINSLILLLADSDRAARSGAARGLYLMGKRAIEPLVTALTNPEPLIRGGAVESLGQIGTEEVVQHLVASLSDPDPNVGQVAVSHLGNIGDPRAIEPLIRCLHFGPLEVRASAAAALGKFPSNGEIIAKALLKAVDDSSEKVRVNAIASLGELRVTDAARVFISALSDTNPSIRYNAILGLRNIRSEEGVEQLGLLMRDSNLVDDSARNQIAYTLGIIGGTRSAEILAQELRTRAEELSINEVTNEDREFLIVLSHGLKTIGDLGVEELINILQVNNLYVNQLIGNVFKEIGPSALGSLSQRYKAVEANDRPGLILAIGLIGDRTGLPLLVDALGDSNSQVRILAAAFLFDIATVEDTYCVQPLIKALEDQEELVRRNACGTLGRFGDLTAVEPLIAMLSDPEPSVRENAAESLGEIGDTRAIEALRRLLDDSDETVRRKSRSALRDLGIRG